MPRLGLGLGLTMGNILGVSLASTLADLYVARVATIPDFVVPSYARVVAGYEALINAYATGTKAAFETATAFFADPSVSGYVLGTGTGLTAGAACARVGNMAWLDDNSRDLVQATPLLQPWLLVHSGTNYVAMPTIATNSITSNTAVTWDPVTQILEVVARVQPSIQNASGNWDNITNQNTLFGLQISNTTTTKTIRVNASTAATASTAYTPSTTVPHFIKVNLNLSQIEYYWSADGITYTAIGTSALPTYGTTGTLTIGGTSNTIANSFYAYSITYSVAGTIVRNFNPASYNASVSQTTFTASTGEVYTLNVGTASTGYKLVMVDRTIMQGNGVDSLLLSGNISYATDRATIYSAVRKLSSTLGLTYTFGSNANRISIVNDTTWRGFTTNAAVNNDYRTTPDNLNVLLLTATLDRSVIGINEQLFYFNNVLQSKTSIENGNTSGNLPTDTSALFARKDGTAPSNCNVRTIIQSRGVDDATVQTALYNYIRSINNNAF